MSKGGLRQWQTGGGGGGLPDNLISADRCSVPNQFSWAAAQVANAPGVDPPGPYAKAGRSASGSGVGDCLGACQQIPNPDVNALSCLQMLGALLL